jgi:hypothetical protein
MVFSGMLSAEEPAVVGTPPSQDSPADIHWHTDYTRATEVAEMEGRMLFIFFYRPGADELCERFESNVLTEPAVGKKLRDYVCAKLPVDVKIQVKGKELSVLGHSAFKEMECKPGVAILDFVHKETKVYRRVVSTFPITQRLWYTPEQMVVILDLPLGTLTQRTLIYAVRTHPENPASTSGQLNSTLLKEAESHSQHQARICRQGHHRWERRFHRINARLSGGLIAREICAESWSGENLVEAAIECVRSWRLSSGHWSAVRARHRCYGYDMKRGRNGVWYATGIFGGR